MKLYSNIDDSHGFSKGEQRWFEQIHLDMQGRFRCLSHEPIILVRTWTDILFPDQRAPIYLDGPIHLHKEVEARDEIINGFLEKFNYNYKRFPYESMTKDTAKDLAKQVCDFIEALPIVRRPP